MPVLGIKTSSMTLVLEKYFSGLYSEAVLSAPVYYKLFYILFQISVSKRLSSQNSVAVINGGKERNIWG
jgi:hypothetical protein